MHSMASSFRYRRRLCALLGLVLSLACDRSQPDQPADLSSPAAEQKIPFHEGTGQGSSAASQPPSAPTGELPFRALSPVVVPSGTLLTVQLQATLSSTKIHPGDTFSAVLAAPIVVDGSTLMERGAPVTVRVESQRSQPYHSGLISGSGYIRLTLTAISMEGKQVTLQTSSLFVKGTLNRHNGIRIPKGRDLTFRLTAPVTLDSTQSIAGRQQSGSLTISSN